MGGEREHTRLTLEGVDDVGRRRWGATAGAHRVHHARRYTWRRGVGMRDADEDALSAAGLELIAGRARRVGNRAARGRTARERAATD